MWSFSKKRLCRFFDTRQLPHGDVLPGHLSPIKTGGQLRRRRRLRPIHLPGPEGQQADKLFRRVPLPQGPHIQIPFPLGQPPAVGGAQQGHVEKRRRRQAQALIEPELPGGGVQQIPPPHHLGDPHVPVVAHHRQLVGIHPVGAAEDEVPAVPEQVFPIGPLEAVGPRQTAALPGVDNLPVGPVGGAGRQPLRPGAVAGVEQALFLQGPEGGGVPLRPLALEVGAVGSPLLPALVPVQAQPAQIVGQLLRVLRAAPVGIQVLHPQHHHAAGAAHRQPRQQGGKQIAQVHPAAGAGGEAAPKCLHGCSPFFRSISGGGKPPPYRDQWGTGGPPRGPYTLPSS